MIIHNYHPVCCDGLEDSSRGWIVFFLLVEKDGKEGCLHTEETEASWHMFIVYLINACKYIYVYYNNHCRETQSTVTFFKIFVYIYI